MTRFAKTLLTLIVIIAVVGWWALSVFRAGTMSEGAARTIAATSSCALVGSVAEDGTRNEVTKTWWFDITPKESEVRTGCNPACVVSETTHTAEVNWRCTGLATTTDGLIHVTAPLPNATTSSPLTVTGEARGTWYFEASFPIRIVDEAGTVLGTGIAQAQSDWMTEEFVPFSATIGYATPTTTHGTLILEKDNPSGLPEHANELRVPINFDITVAPPTRTVSLYYYDPTRDRDAGGNIMCSRNGLVAVERSIPVTQTPIQNTIRLLLQGSLTQDERERGITTEYPLPGVTLSGASLQNGTLTLTLSDPENRTSGGACRAGILWYQIEATALQFPEVRSVRFLPSDIFQP